MNGTVKISLEDYEFLKQQVNQGKKTNDRLKIRVREVMDASKELSSFLSFISQKITNIDVLISAFNQESSTCEILKVEDNSYRIKLINYEEAEEDRN